ncbi:unnamed protein product [Prorocentrum cordatum]|uniref:ATP-dependent DNA helicase n=1 Tax=Prorocentrum cordatum TaxID=2364126 RepID=A0ABN9U8A3_9DINO|nr:unnamed protein product [Polarella glacialis]
MESDDDDNGNPADVPMDDEEATDELPRRPFRAQDPTSVLCGSFPEGIEMDDVIAPETWQKSKAAEAKYIAEFMRDNSDRLRAAERPPDCTVASDATCMRPAASLAAADRQSEFFKMVDAWKADSHFHRHKSPQPAPDALERRLRAAMATGDASTFPPVPPRTRTAVVDACLHLLHNGVLDVVDMERVNVKQARALLWNAAWLQDVMNRRWGFDEPTGPTATGRPSLADGFQLALMGPGGTGKTAVLRVVEAVICYFNGPDTVQKCAPSNSAARLLKGDTLRALCKLPFGNVTVTGKKGRLTRSVLEQHRDRWECALACFIDEVSMVAAAQLFQSEVRLTAAKNSAQAWGGLGMTLSGDFMQLPPVDPTGDSRSLATDPDEVDVLNEKGPDATTKDADKKRSKHVETVQGLQLWRRVRRVVTLDINVRAPGPLSQLLGEMRAGHISDEMWALYTNRILSSNDTRPLDPASPFAMHPWTYIVHRHKIRAYRSMQNARQQALRTGQRVYVVQARDEPVHPGDSRKMTSDVRRALLQKVSPKDTQDLPSLLPLYVGMRLTMYSKDCVRLGLMKGCVCTLRHIVFADGESFPADSLDDNVVHLQYMPITLWLQADGAEWTLPASDLPADLPTCTDRQGLFQMRPTYGYLRATWEEENFSALLFGIVPKEPSPTTGVQQGGTYPAVVADMKKPPSMDADTHWLACYVMLSRPVSVEGLLILRPATRRELSRPPPKFILDEITRLADMETASLDELIQILQDLKGEPFPPEILDSVLAQDGAARQSAEVAEYRRAGPALRTVSRRTRGKTTPPAPLSRVGDAAGAGEDAAAQATPPSSAPPLKKPRLPNMETARASTPPTVNASDALLRVRRGWMHATFPHVRLLLDRATVRGYLHFAAGSRDPVSGIDELAQLLREWKVWNMELAEIASTTVSRASSLAWCSTEGSNATMQHLRAISASIYSQWAPEQVLDFVVAAAMQQRSNAHLDEWDPAALLSDFCFECLLHAECVLAFEEQDDGDALVRIAYTQAHSGAGAREERITRIPGGVANLAQEPCTSRFSILSVVMLLLIQRVQLAAATGQGGQAGTEGAESPRAGQPDAAEGWWQSGATACECRFRCLPWCSECARGPEDVPKASGKRPKDNAKEKVEEKARTDRPKQNAKEKRRRKGDAKGEEDEVPSEDIVAAQKLPAKDAEGEEPPPEAAEAPSGDAAAAEGAEQAPGRLAAAVAEAAKPPAPAVRAPGSKASRVVWLGGCALGLGVLACGAPTAAHAAVGSAVAAAGSGLCACVRARRRRESLRPSAAAVHQLQALLQATNHGVAIPAPA